MRRSHNYNTKSFAIGLVAGGLILTVIGARWMAIQHYAGGLPSFQQWTTMGEQTFVPWLTGELSVADLWSHGDGRLSMGWTRLVTLGLVELNDQWDPDSLAMFDAIWLVVCGAIVIFLIWPLLKGWARVIAPGGLALVCSVPLAWQDVGHPGTIEPLVQVACGAAVIVLIPFRRPGSGGWWVGVLAGCLGLLVSPAWFAAPVVAAILTLRMAPRRRDWTRSNTANAVVVSVMVLLSCVPLGPLPGLDDFRGQRITLVLSRWATSAAFPWPGWVGCVVMQAPLLALLVARARVRIGTGSRKVWILAGLGGWLWLQGLALACAPGLEGGGLGEWWRAWIGVSVVVNACTLGWLFHYSRVRTRLTWAGLSLVWLVALVVGLVRHSERIRDDLDWMSPRRGQLMVALQRLVASGDGSLMPNEHPSEYAIARWGQLLESSEIRRWLPPAIRPPLSLRGATTREFALRPPPHLPELPPYALVRYADGREISHWESEPFAADSVLPILRLRFAGDPRLGGAVLRLTGGATESELTIPRLSGDIWQRAHLFVPQQSGEVRLIAEAGADGKWFAFAAPIEIGRITWAAAQLRKFAGFTWWVGILALLGGMAFVVPWSEVAQQRREVIGALGAAVPVRVGKKASVTTIVLIGLWLILTANGFIAVARFQPNVLYLDQWDFFAPLFGGGGAWDVFSYHMDRIGRGSPLFSRPGSWMRPIGMRGGIARGLLLCSALRLFLPSG